MHEWMDWYDEVNRRVRVRLWLCYLRRQIASFSLLPSLRLQVAFADLNRHDLPLHMKIINTLRVLRLIIGGAAVCWFSNLFDPVSLSSPRTRKCKMKKAKRQESSREVGTSKLTGKEVGISLPRVVVDVLLPNAAYVKYIHTYMNTYIYTVLFFNSL